MSVVTSPSVAATNTTNTNNLGPDGFSWAQSKDFVIDKYGKLITYVNSVAAAACTFLYSNNGGASWADSSLTQPWIIRGSLAYDSRNDVLWVLWLCATATDGILLRKYTISRDGSNNVTGFARDPDTINLQLDYQTASTAYYAHPVLMWLDDSGYGTYGALFAAWGAGCSGQANNGEEVRCSMRVLSGNSNDGVASNWKAPVTDDSPSISQDAQVPYTKVAAQLGTNGGQAATVAANRKVAGTNAKDVVIAYSIMTAGGSKTTFYFKRLQWSLGNNDWSTGMTSQVTISNFVLSGTDSGYNLKQETLTDLRECSVTGDMVIGLNTWKDDTDGDSWGYRRLHTNDTVSAHVHVYAGGASNCGGNIFIVGDVAVDAGRIVASYTTLPNKDWAIRVFDSADVEVQAPLTCFSSEPVDIPIVYQVGFTSRWDLGSGDRLLVHFRDFNPEARSNPPTYSGSGYLGYFATLNWDSLAARLWIGPSV